MDWRNSWLADFVNSSSSPPDYADPAFDFAVPQPDNASGDELNETRTRSRSFSSRKDSPGITRKNAVPVPAIPVASVPISSEFTAPNSGSFTAPPSRRSGNYSGVLRTSGGAPTHTPTQLVSNVSMTQDDTIVPRTGSPKRVSRPAAKSISSTQAPVISDSSTTGKVKVDSVRRATTSVPFVPTQPPPPPPRTDLPASPMPGAIPVKRAQSSSISQTERPQFIPPPLVSPRSATSPPKRPPPATPLVDAQLSPRKESERPPSMHPAEKRSRVMHEILSSEETYIQGLERLVDGFMANIRKLGEKHASAKQISTVFSNIEQILTFQREFYASLKASVAVDLLPTAGQAPPLGVVFIRMAPFLKSYAIYAANYATALTVLSEWRSSSTINNLLEQGRKSYGQDIEFYLILPIQRIPRYELLLRDLLAVTPETHQDYHELTEALKNVKQVADHVNSLVKQYQNSERAIALGLKELLAPARRLVVDGVYQCEIVSRAPQAVAGEAQTLTRSSSSSGSSSRTSIQLVLFNDLLIRNEGAKKKRGLLKSKYHWPIQLVWLRELPAAAVLIDSAGNTEMEYPLEVLGPDACYIIYLKTQQERTTVLREYTSCIVEQMTSKDAPHDPEVRFAKYRFSDGGQYDGWWQRSKRHGMGTYTIMGSKYIGEWLSDKMNGQGKLHYVTGAIYSGAFSEGKPHGKGSLTDENGNVYDGSWARGIKNGRGKLTYVDGSYYLGDFKDDRIEGRGIFKTPSGMVYEGSWLNDRFEGQGKLLTATGKEYVGSWKDGLKHGNGLLKYHDGSFYQGEFKDNKKHGQGTLDRSGLDGTIYIGSWIQGLKEGQGVMAYLDGTKYEGSFKADQPNGVGVFTYCSGVFLKYAGEVSRGQRHGKGTLTWMKGGRFEGGFKNDSMHGSGVFTTPEGLQIDGKWQMGRLEGKCTLKFPGADPKQKDSKDVLLKYAAFFNPDASEMQFPEVSVAIPHPVALPTLAISLSYHQKVNPKTANQGVNTPQQQPQPPAKQPPPPVSPRSQV